MRAEQLPRRGPVWIAAISAAAALALTSCGGSGEPSAAATAETPQPTAAPQAAPTTTDPASTTTTTVVPTTTPRATTTGPSTTQQIATSTTTTTTTIPLPVPVAVPADLYASEPVIELGSIEIPAIGVDMTMYEGIRMTTLDYGPGHWPGSAMPGEAGNVVVAGHRTTKHRVFRDLDQLVAGDELLFHDATGTHTYAVREVQIVPPSALWIIEQAPASTATLFACHPPGSTRERIVVFADLVT